MACPRVYRRNRPPLMWINAPLMNRAASLTRNKTAEATSSAVPLCVKGAEAGDGARGSLRRSFDRTNGSGSRTCASPRSASLTRACASLWCLCREQDASWQLYSFPILLMAYATPPPATYHLCSYQVQTGEQRYTVYELRQNLTQEEYTRELLAFCLQTRCRSLE